MKEKVVLNTIGPSAGYLVPQLVARGWTVFSVEQINTQRGRIVGEHHDPDSFLGFGINDGTRVLTIEHDANQHLS